MKEKETYFIKVNLPGGVVSAGDLYELLIIAENAGADQVSIGNRQQLYFSVAASRLEDLETDMLTGEISHEVRDDLFPNILSSYVADNTFNTESWLKEGVYKDIFDLFDFKPGLKINLVDQHQTFVPFFSGNFNFISSGISNYWYLYVRFPKTSSLYCWPSLVYSDDIPAISKIAENIIMENRQWFYDIADINPQAFYEMVTKGNRFVNQPITEPLKLPDFSLPFYEGFNKYVNDKYWLGIYRRNELFPVAFLKDVCSLCLKSRVGQLYTTPWKSLLIKGINEGDRKEWGAILNKYQINVRHAANELNWQLENLCKDSLKLKKKLVREFEACDQRTYRLCFAIKMQPKTGLPASVIIKKQQPGFFDILHTRDFNPNSKDFVVFKSNIQRNKLGKHLVELCRIYYTLLIGDNISAAPEKTESADCAAAEETYIVHQCKNCLSIYDEAFGDDLNGISAGTDFETISDYFCPICEAPKPNFVKVEKKVASYQLY